MAGLSGRAPVPSLFWHEARNILLIAERRGRIGAGEAASAMARLRRLPLEDAGAGRDGAILAIAAAHGLSAYDAVYRRSRRSVGCRSPPSTGSSPTQRGRKAWRSWDP